MENMIEHGIAKAIVSIALKPLLAALVAFGWWPVADAILLQVNDHVLLDPITNKILEESKIILGVLISIAVLVKIIVGTIKLSKKK